MLRARNPDDGLTKDALLERNARLANRLRTLAVREHRAHDPAGPIRECPNPECRKTWQLLERFTDVG